MTDNLRNRLHNHVENAVIRFSTMHAHSLFPAGGLLNTRWPGGGLRGVRPTRLLALGLALAAAFPVRAATDMAALSLEQLMEITVVGASKYAQKQSEVAAAVSVITREEIQTFGWRTLAEALTSLPGVHSTYDRQYTYLGTRGLSQPGDLNLRVLVTINGNRVNEASYDSATLGREFLLDLDLIDRIEFIPGPGGAVYGQNALFGVVNVVTRDGADIDGTEMVAAVQSPQRLREGRVSVGRRLDSGLDLLVSASGLRARGENRFYDFGDVDDLGVNVAGVATDMDGERDKEFFTRMTKGPWSFELIHGDRRKDDPTALAGSDPLVPNQFIRDRYLLTQAQYQGELADPSLELLARVFWSEYRYHSEAPYWGNWYLFTGATSSRGGELRLLSTALPAHKLMVGVELQDNRRQDMGREWLGYEGERYLFPNSGWRAGVYVQDEWRMSQTLAATLGLRVDRNSVNGTQSSPRAALIWQATPASTLKAMVGRAHRAPNAAERSWDFSNEDVPTLLPAVDSEVIDTRELVFDHRMAPDLSFRGALYQWALKDLIVWDKNTWQWVSGPRMKASGLELSANKTWDWGGRLRASLSRQQARFAHGVGLANSPNWLGKLHFSTPLPAAGLRLGYEWQLESARRAASGARVSGHGLSNLHLVAERWAPGVSVSLGIHNLFDKAYSQPVSDGGWVPIQSQDGRSVRLKMELRF